MSSVTLNILLCAMAWVESRFDPSAVNKAEGAVGILQIRPCVVEDVNRISKDIQLVTLDQRKEVAASFLVAEMYLTYWGGEYTKETGLQASPQVLARIWNGGPDGWKQDCTLEYWEKVNNRVLEMMEVK